jgi:hypothetical protein
MKDESDGHGSTADERARHGGRGPKPWTVARTSPEPSKEVNTLMTPLRKSSTGE